MGRYKVLVECFFQEDMVVTARSKAEAMRKAEDMFNCWGDGEATKCEAIKPKEKPTPKHIKESEAQK